MTQIEYIEILFSDLGYLSSQKRDWLSLRFGVRYADELTSAQRHLVIEELKASKPAREDEDDDQ